MDIPLTRLPNSVSSSANRRFMSAPDTISTPEYVSSGTNSTFTVGFATESEARASTLTATVTSCSGSRRMVPDAMDAAVTLSFSTDSLVIRSDPSTVTLNASGEVTLSVPLAKREERIRVWSTRSVPSDPGTDRAITPAVSGTSIVPSPILWRRPDESKEENLNVSPCGLTESFINGARTATGSEELHFPVRGAETVADAHTANASNGIDRYFLIY